MNHQGVRSAFEGISNWKLGSILEVDQKIPLADGDVFGRVSCWFKTGCVFFWGGVFWFVAFWGKMKFSWGEEMYIYMYVNQGIKVHTYIFAYVYIHI